MKNKLSKKAQAFLKAQGGLQVPYEYPYQDNTSPFDLGQIDPNLQTAQQNQLISPPIQPQPVQQQSSSFKQSLSGLGSIGAGIKQGMGIVSLFQAAKERKKAKRREANAERDLERRMKESRENDFYYTGNTSGMYSDFNKNGGQVYQDGGFMDFYNQQENQNKITQQNWNNYYAQHIEQQKEKAHALKQQGWSDIVGGVTDQLGQAMSILSGGVMKRGGILSKAIKYQIGGIQPESTRVNTFNPSDVDWYKPDTNNLQSINNERASFVFNFKKEEPALFDMMMGKNPEKINIKRYTQPVNKKSRLQKQDGGKIEEIEEINEDLYSSEFQSPVESKTSYFQEVMNKFQALDPQGSLENKAMNWIFEEEPEPKRYDVSEVFQNQEKPILKVVEDFKMMGLNPSSVDTGKHNVGSRHYQGKAVDLGLNTTFGGDINKMRKFKQWFETEGKNKYPGLKLIDETVRPVGQKEWSGIHYHLEY